MTDGLPVTFQRRVILGAKALHVPDRLPHVRFAQLRAHRAVQRQRLPHPS